MTSPRRTSPFIRPFKAPVETKVTTGTLGAGAAGAVSLLVLWLLGIFVWGGPATAPNAAYTVSLVPSPVSGVVILTVPAIGAFIGGWIGRHTPRPDLEDS